MIPRCSGGGGRTDAGPCREIDRLQAENDALRRLNAQLTGRREAISLSGWLGLSPREAELAALLWKRSPEPLDYETILEAAYWNDQDGGADRATLKCRLTKLKTKLADLGAPAGLKTVHGQDVMCDAALSAWFANTVARTH